MLKTEAPQAKICIPKQALSWEAGENRDTTSLDWFHNELFGSIRHSQTGQYKVCCYAVLIIKIKDREKSCSVSQLYLVQIHNYSRTVTALQGRGQKSAIAHTCSIQPHTVTHLIHLTEEVKERESLTLQQSSFHVAAILVTSGSFCLKAVGLDLYSGVAIIYCFCTMGDHVGVSSPARKLTVGRWRFCAATATLPAITTCEESRRSQSQNNLSIRTESGNSPVYSSVTKKATNACCGQKETRKSNRDQCWIIGNEWYG